MGLLSSARITTGRILVVDDDPGARELIASSLRADGHEVDASGSGFEALRLLGRQWYDLVVSDLMMPELDGPMLYSAVTHRWPISRPQFLFVSGVNPSAYEGFLKVVHATLLPKPFKVGALRRTIKRLLQPRA